MFERRITWARPCRGALGLWMLATVACGSELAELCKQDLASTAALPSEVLARFEEALEEGRLQQVAWALRRRGEVGQASRVEACLRAILSEGEVLARERLGGGISATFRLSLPRGVSAVLKTTSSFKGCYRHELAAYELDQRLNLQTVPMTVERTVDGRTGSVQFFVEDALPAHRAESPRMTPELLLLDVLIDNEDRHAGNWLIYEFDGRRQVVGIDHNLTFGCRRYSNRSARPLREVDARTATRLRVALEGLSDDELAALLEPFVTRSRAIRRAQKARATLLKRLGGS